MGCFCFSCVMTSFVSPNTPPLVVSFRKRSSELIWPSSTSLAKTLDLSGGSDVLSFPIRPWIILPSRSSLLISPCLKCVRRLDKTSWWSFAFHILYGTNLAVNLRLNQVSVILYGTNLAVNFPLNQVSVILCGTNLAVNLRLNRGSVILYGTNLAVNLRLNRVSAILHGTNLAVNLTVKSTVRYIIWHKFSRYLTAKSSVCHIIWHKFSRYLTAKSIVR